MPDESVTREVFGNIDAVSKGLFYALVVAALASFAIGVFRRVRLWRLGRRSDRQLDWRACLRAFFGQVVLHTALRRGRPAAGWAHLLLFGGFGILFVGTVLIAVEHYAASAVGREPTDPLFHKGVYFAVYEFLLDSAGLALLAGCGWFVARRLRSDSSVEQGTLDWLVLSALILLGFTGYVAEGLRIIREQTPQPGYSFVGYGAAQLFQLAGVTPANVDAFHFGLWWTHSLLALGFIAAFPYTRLLHSIAGAVNLATRTRSLGELSPLSIEDVETTGLVGVANIQDFTRRQLLELDACVSCGRCQDLCPAFEAGKPLSPRNVVQQLRREMERFVVPSEDREAGEQEAIAPLCEVIGEETLWSCTTCHACVDICPLGVDPLTLISDLRRNLVAEGGLRGAPAASLQKMQRSGNPWGLPAADRWGWAEGLDVPRVADHPDFDVLYWVGCAAAYDRRTRKVARAVVRLLQQAGVDFAVLGPEERCTGESARRMGEEFLFQELAAANLETLTKHSVRKILTHCPHCFNSFKNDYPQFGGQFEVVHHSQFLSELVAAGKLKTDGPTAGKPQTYHDPCYLARVNEVTEQPRKLLEFASPGNTRELPRAGRDTACCGAGGGRMWFDDGPEGRIGESRLREVQQSGAKQLVVGCPFCLTMLSDGLAARDQDIEVVDLAELLVEKVELD